ncbi:MAG: family deacetylase [Nocardioidaceae bacterium]|nr:family deacetylase [Nocardioidaceae bacterium]
MPRARPGKASHATVPIDADTLATLGTVLTVWAHPDDETYLAGGLLAALTDAGQRVVCVTATRGEAADPTADQAARDELVRLRTSELAAALRLLGVSDHRWLDYPDGGCSAVDPGEAASRLAQILDEVEPDTVLTFGPDGFTGHPDHRVVSAWTDRAVARSASSPRVLHAVARYGSLALGDTYGVYALGAPRQCHEHELAVRLALKGSALDRKVAALRLQHSQTAGLIEAMGVEPFADWVSVEAFADPEPQGAIPADDAASRAAE